MLVMRLQSRISPELKLDIYLGTLFQSLPLCLTETWSQLKVSSMMETVRFCHNYTICGAEAGCCSIRTQRLYSLNVSRPPILLSQSTSHNGYSSIRMYAASNMRDQIEPKLVWATPGQRGFPSRQRTNASQAPVSAGPSRVVPPPPVQQRGAKTQTPAQKEAIRKQQEALQKAAELKQMLNNLEKVDDESRRSSLLDTLCSMEDVLNLPLHPNPPSISNGDLKVDLLKHQVYFSAYSIPPLSSHAVRYSESGLAVVCRARISSFTQERVR